jgi:hypothetical protein
LEDVEGLEELQESIPSIQFKIGGEDTIWSKIITKENEIKETNPSFKGKDTLILS